MHSIVLEVMNDHGNYEREKLYKTEDYIVILVHSIDMSGSFLNVGTLPYS